MQESIYEVWTQTYDTFGEYDWTMAYRFSDETVARAMRDKLNEGWGNRAEMRYGFDPTLPPVLDATVEDVEAWWASNRYGEFPGMEEDEE